MARILLAEDDASLRAFLSARLRRSGHRVETASCGEAALALLQRSGFDLVLIDLAMPGIDGIELAREAGERCSTTRVMFITGFSAIAVSRAGELAMRPRDLSRPFHLRHLPEQVGTLLAA